MQQDYWFLPAADFLGNLLGSDRDALLALGHSQQVRKGKHVFSSGAPGTNVYLLTDGRAKIYKLAASGKEVILWFCFPGELFGIAEVSRGGTRGVFAQVLTDAHVHVIRREDFTQFLREHPEVALQVIDVLSCRMRVLDDMLLNLATDDVSARVVKLLTRLCTRYGKHKERTVYLDIPLTHQEMADMIGATRQTVTSILNRLKRQGILRVENHRIEVESDQLLRELGGNQHL